MARQSSWATWDPNALGANDAATMLKLDNNETVSQHLRALLEERALAEAVKVAGLWDGIGEHSNTWKRADGTPEWRLREVFINENPSTEPRAPLVRAVDPLAGFRTPCCAQPLL